LATNRKRHSADARGVFPSIIARDTYDVKKILSASISILKNRQRRKISCVEKIIF